jgi:hypothetical protein
MDNSYKKRGLYKEQLERYFQFFPRNQILTVFSEELFEFPVQTLKLIFRFIGVDDQIEIPKLKPYNVSKNRVEVSPEVYVYLDDYFKPNNEALFDLLGRRYKWGSSDHDR